VLTLALNLVSAQRHTVHCTGTTINNHPQLHSEKIAFWSFMFPALFLVKGLTKYCTYCISNVMFIQHV
jgi:hypothetical protein